MLKKQKGRRRGRPLGAKNKVTVSMKGAVLEAFDALGGAEGLTKWAKTKSGKTEFYKIASKLIPTEIAASEGGNVRVIFNIT